MHKNNKIIVKLSVKDIVVPLWQEGQKVSLGGMPPSNPPMYCGVDIMILITVMTF